MNRRIAISLILVALTLFFGCESYTAQTAKKTITPPEPIAEGELVTKYSLYEAEEKAKKEAEEAQLLQEQLQAEREHQDQLLQEAQTLIDALEEEKRNLEERLHETLQSLEAEKEKTKNLSTTIEKATLSSEDLNAVHQQTIEKNLQLEERLNETLQSLESEKEKTKELRTTIENTTLSSEDLMAVHQQNIETLEAEIASLSETIEELKEEKEAGEQSYEMLSYQATELENLYTEQQVINNELQTILHESEQDHASEIATLKASYEEKLIVLDNTIESLQADNAILKNQLEEKTQSLEERLRLEQQRIEEAQRLEAEQAERQRAIQEAQRKAEAEQLARQAALDAEYQQIPPLSELTFPRQYTTDEKTILFEDNSQLQVLMIPLDDTPWQDKSMATLVEKSISDLASPVILVTGHMQNVIDLVRELRRNAVLVEGGAIITSLAILNTSTSGASAQFSNTKTVRLSVANLPEYEVLKAFSSGGDWQTIQNRVTEARKTELKHIIAEGSSTESTIIGASLFEPSYQDWNTFSPVPYRQIDYLWPLSNYLEESSFYDVYRNTHFSADTDAGNTFITADMRERIDYLYSRKALPLHSSMLTIGGESVSDAQGIARYGIAATFLIP